ncbi:MAG: ATP-grasp domain-containing protein [Alphaproteobacteria bacterium]|nr:ATP-grasp domain-containing protein [Alphaproteobacteria bacterium]
MEFPERKYMLPTENFTGKKILIMGGAFLNKQLVEVAKAMGIVTYVTDIDDVVHSPAKLVADKYYNIDVNDVEAIVKLCKKEEIDGVIVGGYHAPYEPYIQVCKQMGYPCLATEQQYELFSLKDNFEATCRKCGIDTPQNYQENEITEDFTAYPIIVKPVDGSGSKGQSVCHNFIEAKKAIAFGKEKSRRKRVIIEEFLPTQKEIMIECLIKDGQLYESLITDFYYGSSEMGVGRVFKLITVSDRSIDFYFKEIKPQIEKMIKFVGIKNSIFIVQGKRNREKI